MIWLIAEDEADILNLIATMCQVWGHSAITFENGQKVWDWLDTIDSGKYTDKMPEFVLMDIRMPGKKGNDVARRMRTMSAFKPIPIALMTAYSLSVDERKAIMETDGVDEILSKPLPNFEELRTQLNHIIQTKQATKQS